MKPRLKLVRIWRGEPARVAWMTLKLYRKIPAIPNTSGAACWLEKQDLDTEQWVTYVVVRGAGGSMLVAQKLPPART